MYSERFFENLAEEVAAGGGMIYVAPGGSDKGLGTLWSPFATLLKAKSLLSASRKNIALRGGSYVETFDWPSLTGVKIFCLDGDGLASIRGAVGGVNVISVNPAVATGTWEMTLKGIELSHRTGTVGLQIDNAYVAKRMNIYLKNISTNQEGTGSSIDVNRSGAASDAIRIYADGNGETIEGLVTVISESTDDRFRFKNYRLIGGFTAVGTIVSEITLISCGLPAAPTVDGAEALSNINCWIETDANPNVYTALTDHYHT